MAEFTQFQKIPRLSRECVVTEKIDGTNACIYIGENGEFLAGSRTRWITPQDDNFGFAKWAYEHKEELLKLGIGRHFGEWWGSGIQRNYGLMEKRWSLFNVSIWGDDAVRPACCHVVPVLFQGSFDTYTVDRCIEKLVAQGSLASPGFTKPEGVVIYHVAAASYFKKTIEKDAEYKGKNQ